jgi:hypothetical protein
MMPPTRATREPPDPRPRRGRIPPRQDRPGRPRCCRRRARAQRPSRDRRTVRTTSGIGSPVAVLRQPDGRDGPETGTRARRSDGSIRCCVPTRRERRRPERIHRRTVSGLQPTRRAASGTVSMFVAYYNIDDVGGSPRRAPSGSLPTPKRHTRSDHSPSQSDPHFAPIDRIVADVRVFGSSPGESKSDPPDDAGEAWVVVPRPILTLDATLAGRSRVI